MRINRVTLIGAGAVGAFLAPRLYEILGSGFHIIADGARRERLLSNGITVNGVRYDFPIDRPGDTDVADLILIAVKDYSLDEALEQIRGQVGPDTMIMPLLNGVVSEERCAEVYGWEHVLYASMRVSVSMSGDKTEYDPAAGTVRFGEEKNEIISPRVHAVADLFRSAGIIYKIEPDMKKCIWIKFISNVSENMTTAMLGVPYAAFLRSDHANAIRNAATDEVRRVAFSCGVDITDEEINEKDSYIMTMKPDKKTSTLQDIERGRRTEAELLAGTAVRLGKLHGVPTPVCEMLYHGVKVLEEKNAGLFK